MVARSGCLLHTFGTTHIHLILSDNPNESIKPIKGLHPIDCSWLLSLYIPGLVFTQDNNIIMCSTIGYKQLLTIDNELNFSLMMHLACSASKV